MPSYLFSDRYALYTFAHATLAKFDREIRAIASFITPISARCTTWGSSAAETRGNTTVYVNAGDNEAFDSAEWWRMLYSPKLRSLEGSS